LVEELDRGKPKMIVSDNGTELTFERHPRPGSLSRDATAIWLIPREC
jgi:hypothetical protein